MAGSVSNCSNIFSSDIGPKMKERGGGWSSAHLWIQVEIAQIRIRIIFSLVSVPFIVFLVLESVPNPIFFLARVDYGSETLLHIMFFV